VLRGCFKERELYLSAKGGDLLPSSTRYTVVYILLGIARAEQAVNRVNKGEVSSEMSV
jgi:hypothetical protein